MVLLFSCRKEEEMQDAVITGIDGRMCVCCGGLMVSFGGDTIPYSGEFSLANNDPSEFGMDISTLFPVFVRVNYTRVDSCGGYQKIHISKLEVAKN